jgi:hypothetical protein
MRYTIKILPILVVVVTILPVLIAIPFHVANLFQRDRAALDQSVQLTTRVLLQSVDGNLRAAQNGLNLLAGSEALTRGDLAQFYQRGADLVNLGMANNVVVLDETGQQLINTLKPLGEPLPKTGNMANVQRIFATGNPIFSDLFLYRLPIDFIFIRHTRECGYPVSLAADRWIPAFAGMTTVNTKTYS